MRVAERMCCVPTLLVNTTREQVASEVDRAVCKNDGETLAVVAPDG